MKILYQVADKYILEDKQSAIELENIIEKYNLKNKKGYLQLQIKY